MVHWIQKIFKRLLSYEPCVGTFTLSACVGIYIAFSPFVGFHTAMVFLFAWIFRLNFSVVLGASVLINNPWTMVPVYGLSYLTGDRLLSWWGVNHYAWNPSWVTKGNELLGQYVGVSGFSFWAFMIGGNLLGALCALIAYPFIRLGARMVLTGTDRVRTVITSRTAVRSVAGNVHTAPAADHAVQKGVLPVHEQGGDHADHRAK